MCLLGRYSCAIDWHFTVYNVYDETWIARIETCKTYQAHTKNYKHTTTTYACQKTRCLLFRNWKRHKPFVIVVTRYAQRKADTRSQY